MALPPGPRLPPLVQAAFVTAAPYGWMRRRRSRHGDVFSSNFPYYGRVVYVADPAEVKRVFTGDPTTFHAGEANTLALGDLLGDHSLLTLDEERQLSQRKLLWASSDCSGPRGCWRGWSSRSTTTSTSRRS